MKQILKCIKQNEAGPIAERSNSLDRGRGDPSSNPGEGCYWDGERNKHRIVYISTCFITLHTNSDQLELAKVPQSGFLAQ